MVEHFKDVLNQRKGQKIALDKSLEDRKEDLKKQLNTLLDLEECKLIVQAVTENAQNQLAETLNSIVTDALGTVWTDGEYSFKMKIESKANTVQAIPVIVKDGEEYSPKSDCGGGISQVVGLALRVALLALQKDSSPILLLDEPLVAVDKMHMDLACKLLQTISEKMGIQIVTITHEEGIKEVADKLFHIKLNGKESVVEVL